MTTACPSHRTARRKAMRLHKIRIALAAIIMALTAVSAVDSASPGWGDIELKRGVDIDKGLWDFGP
jgi:hypothetical protein